MKHASIDSICIVSVAEWLDYMRELVVRYGFRKVHWMVPGGETPLESQLNGLQAVAEDEGVEDVNVLIHDGVRPLIDEQTITDCVEALDQYGSAVVVAPVTETVLTCEKDKVIALNRSECLFARAPQCFRLEDILSAHGASIREGKRDFIDSTSMMLYYHKGVHFVEGPEENLKVTNPADFYICRALLDAREESQIFGL